MNLLTRLALCLPPIRRLHEARNVISAERDNLQSEKSHLIERYEKQISSLSQSINTKSSVFTHYHSVFDGVEIINRHTLLNVEAHPDFYTNFMGVRVHPTYFPSFLNGRQGTIEPPPIPANWHADIAEWAASLRAVDLARGDFTVIELGCGWGCWLNNAGAAARRAGLAVHLIGVEGDEGHIGFAREACAVNGFTPDQVTLHHGIAAPAGGVALFPRQNQAGVKWGLEPVFGATEAETQAALAAGSHDALPMIALADLTAGHDRIDLLHIDIQGGETSFIAGCLPILAARVAYILVGTHARQIEGRIMEMLLAEGWRLEIERPAIFALEGGVPDIRVDGVQGWRNPRLVPDGKV